MTFILFLVFFLCLLVSASAFETAANWVHKSPKFYVFVMSILYTVTFSAPAFFVGYMIWQRIR